MKIIKNIITTLFFINVVNIINCHKQPPLFKCVHNISDEKNDFPNIVIETSPKQKEAYKRRMEIELDSEGFKEFNIYLDLYNIKKDIKKYKLNKYEDLLISSMKKAISTIQTLLKVKPLKQGYQISTYELNYYNIMEFNNSMFGDEAINKHITLQTLGIDLAIFGSIEDLDNSTLASASARRYQDDDGQPYIGIVKINKNADYSKTNSQEYFQVVLIHEFTHILGFSKHFFQTYYNNIFQSKDKYNIDRLYLKGNKLLQVAKKYFNCPTLQGVELENQGGEGTMGSHWEARILLGEYMNGYSYSEEQVISEFTLAVLEDSGYYKPNYYTGGLMRFGKNKGCEFLENNCIDKQTHEMNEKFENEFYDSISSDTGFDAGCSSGRQSRTYRILWDADDIPEEYRYFENPNIVGYEPADYCPVSQTWVKEESKMYYVGHCSSKGSKTEYGTMIENQNNLNENFRNYIGEVLSDHSFCFLSSLSKQRVISSVVRANCYEVFCSEKSLTVKIFKDYIVCPRAGGKIEVDGYEGFLLCPDYNLICTGTRICNDMYSCVDKKSEIKEDSYNYDYNMDSSQNIEKAENAIPDNTNNYELSENGKCPINCKHCTEKKICLKCKDTYGLLLESNNEVVCEDISNLQEGYYKNESNIYIKCIDNCKECNDKKTCDKCFDNYYYYQKQCKPVEEGKQLTENCHEYDYKGDCIKCITGYGFEKDKIDHCYEIENKFTQSYTEDGISYYPCVKKNEDWTKCYYNKTEFRVKGLECVPGKYLVQKGTGICYTEEEILENTGYYMINNTHAGICSKAIPNCEECDSDINCITCKKNYKFNIDNNECIIENKQKGELSGNPEEEYDTTISSSKISSSTTTKRRRKTANSVYILSNFNIIKIFYILLFLII